MVVVVGGSVVVVASAVEVVARSEAGSVVVEPSEEPPEHAVASRASAHPSAAAPATRSLRATRSIAARYGSFVSGTGTEARPRRLTAAAQERQHEAVRRVMVVAALSVAVLLSGCGRSDSAQVATEGERATTTTTSPPAALAPERRSWISDGDGRRGWFTDADEMRQRMAIKERLLAKQSILDDALSPSEQEARLDALSVIYPIEVLGGDGELVGYYTTTFVPLDEYPAQLAAAKALIAEAEAGS